MRLSTGSKTLAWIGIVLILIVGIIHALDTPDSFEEATYKGVLFAANGIGALIVAVGIYRNERWWGWALGALVAGGSILGYVISRTVGLPGLEVEEWLEPMGVVSLVVEGLYLVVYFIAMTRQTTHASRGVAACPTSRIR